MRRGLILSLAVLSVLLIAASVARNRVWQDDLHLWQDAAAKNNGMTARTRCGLGDAYTLAERYDEAARQYRQAIVFSPGSVDAHYNLGTVYLKLRRFEEAVLELQRALTLDPGHVEARGNLGLAYWKLDRLDDAIREFRDALQLRPDYTDAYLNLELALIQQNRRRGVH